MDKVLKTFVVLILLLSIGALTLGIMLFNKRELLKGRTAKLEQGLIRLGRTIEAESPEPPPNPEAYPERDISAVTAEVIEEPTRAQFWSQYRQELEQLDFPVMDLNAQRRELMSYYKIDPVTSKPERDPLTGLPITDGPGTMQGVIDALIERAGEQYNLLTATRQQLQMVRAELVSTIQDLNEQKKTLRDRLAHIVTLNNEISQLNLTISGLRRDLDLANERIQEQQLLLADLEQEKLLLEEEKDSLKIKVDELNEVIKSYTQVPETGGAKPTPDGGRPMVQKIDIGQANLTVGPKGRVVSVDQQHLFVVMELDPAFIGELLSGSTDGSFPMLELLVQRGEDDPTFITKVRITQLKQDMNLAIGDILTDWQQGPIQFGDIVYYQ